MISEKPFIGSIDELATLKAIFMRHDPDSMGFITSAEVSEGLRELGRDPSTVAAILHEFDPEGTAPVDFEQWLRIAASTSAPPRPPVPGQGGDTGDIPPATYIPTASGPVAVNPPSFDSQTVEALLETPHPTFPGGSSSSGASMQAGAGSSVGPRTIVGANIVTSGDYFLNEEGPDPKVEEFLRVLGDYRVKCEKDGNYAEAERAAAQFESVRKAEETRRIRALKTRHAVEKNDVLAAHARQFEEFNAAWSRYLTEFDSMAQLYVQQMKDRHDSKFQEFQMALHAELMARPIKFSRELLEWRGREITMVKQRRYAEASRTKALADELERRERKKLDEERLVLVSAREQKYRVNQSGEVAALLKRIEARRAEHVKQRELDSKRLLQRNKNVLAVLDQRHILEEQRFTSSVKLWLPSRTSPMKSRRGMPLPASAAALGSEEADGLPFAPDAGSMGNDFAAMLHSPPSGVAGRPPSQATRRTVHYTIAGLGSEEDSRPVTATMTGSSRPTTAADLHALMAQKLKLSSGGAGSPGKGAGSPRAAAGAGAGAGAMPAKYSPRR